MSNLFSIFDPNAFLPAVGTVPANWVAARLILILIPGSFWLQKGQLACGLVGLLSGLRAEVVSVLGATAPPGSILALFTLFSFIIGSNVLGLFPYIFTRSRHLSYTMALALPLWGGRILWSVLFQINNMLCHIVPTGTPGPLMPVMVVIETVSNFIRPGALAVRLAANMVAGHLLLSLLGGQGPGSRGVALVAVMGSLLLLMILECAVACIQAYVFTILRTLYLDELIRGQFNSYIAKTAG